MQPEVSGYVLAGGRSSRMGQDKCLLRLGGRTLVEWAVSTLQSCTGDVTVVGPDVLPGVQAIRDEVPGHGPLGGIEAALSHLGRDWAAFLPVDMPLLPPGLYAALISDWLSKAETGCHLGFLVVDQLPQPLVSLMHKSTLPFVRGALRAGQNKVVPVLKSAGRQIAFDLGLSEEAVLRRIEFTAGEASDLLPWSPAGMEIATRHLWFTNCNTPQEFYEAEEVLGLKSRDATGVASQRDGTGETR